MLNLLTDWWRPVFAYMFHFLLLKHHQNPIGLHRCQSSSKVYFLLFVWIYINETRLILIKRNPYPSWFSSKSQHTVVSFAIFLCRSPGLFLKEQKVLVNLVQIVFYRESRTRFLSILLVLVLFEFEKVFRKIKVEIS